MVNFILPKISPIPKDTEFTGKYAVITGASSGLGLEVTRQLLRMHASSVILAVRNVAKGEACAETLRQECDTQNQSPKSIIKVMELDMDRYDSVQRFAKQLREEIPVVDLLILNAGIGLWNLERSSTGHERTIQVNYYSNVLLIAELLPYLEAGAETTGSPARISWVGSRAHEMSSLDKVPIEAGGEILENMDKDEAFTSFQRYGDSKLLCALFMYSLAPRLDPKKVIINMVCPGMVNTSMSDVLPIHLRLIMIAVKAMRARSVEVGGWIILNGALVAGPESHGKFLKDKAIADKSRYISSPAGQEAQKKLWGETIAEMSKLTSLPVEFQ
ncbi:unnamed protein product [Penicillium pancosmium]